MIYFHSFRSPGLIVDIVHDIRALNDLARKSKKAGMIVLGGGVCKHQIANAMLIVNNTTLRLIHLVPLISTFFPALAQRRGLFGVHCMRASSVMPLRCVDSVLCAIEHRPRIRWIRLWSSTRRSCIMGENTCRGRICQSQWYVFWSCFLELIAIPAGLRWCNTGIPNACSCNICTRCASKTMRLHGVCCYAWIRITCSNSLLSRLEDFLVYSMVLVHKAFFLHQSKSGVLQYIGHQIIDVYYISSSDGWSVQEAYRLLCDCSLKHLVHLCLSLWRAVLDQFGGKSL